MAQSRVPEAVALVMLIPGSHDARGTSGFQLFLAALQLWPPVEVSIASMRNARRRISQAPRSAERDLDDAIYLACAVDGHAHLLTMEDSDLRLLGESYGNVQIVSWRELKAELSRLGLVN